MNTSDRELILMVQDFLMLHVLQDATATAHHELAAKLYTVTHLRVTRQRPHLEQFTKWQKSKENTVRDNPLGELMVYQGLFPGRVLDLLLELLT